MVASVNCIAEVTWSGSIDQENCDAVVNVMENENIIYTERLHFPGEYGLTACFDSRMYACLAGDRNDESVVEAANKGGKQTFRNSSGQICYFENFDVYFGNMGCFSKHPDFLSYVNAKVSCEESSSIPLYCAKSEKMARQVLLASQELACKEKDGAFEGDVYAFERDDGSTEYCVSASCDVCDTRWRDEYMNRWKENECCKNRNKEPNLNNGTCVAPPAPGPGKIGVNYSKITAMPGCSEEEAGEGENFCEVPKSSSSSGSSSSQSSSSFSSSSVPSSSSLNSSSSGLSSSSSEKQEPAKCFPSNDEADVALLDARVTCESNGGVPNYSLDEYNCLVGSCPPPSSSSKAKSSSSEKVSSSSETSSSSEVSSSSKTSSSSANSSSSEIRSSSSSETKVSSSSKIQSSSSGIGNLGYGICQDFPLAKVPSNPKSACFNYNGTCYKCNSSKYGSACSSDWLWIYSFQSHLVGDWYEKVSCETGEKEVEKGIGVCSAFPGSTPANVSACYAYNGACYVCDKSESYIDCKADWLWNYNFPTHSWFKQVDCYDPYEEEEEGQCPDGSVLLKRTVDNGDYGTEGNGYAAEFVPTLKSYDALGRKAKLTSTKQIIYVDNRLSTQINLKQRNWLDETIDNIFSKMNNGFSRKVLFKRDDCGKERVDYGIIEKDGSLTGGITCPDFRPSYDTPRVVEGPIFGDECEVGGCKSKNVKLKVGVILQMKNFGIDYYVVESGFIFSNGHITTETEHTALIKHEKGHVVDFKCIANKFPKEGKYIEIEIESCNVTSALEKTIHEKMIPYENQLRNNTNLRTDAATVRYHKKYGSFKYPTEKYVCPKDL